MNKISLRSFLAHRLLGTPITAGRAYPLFAAPAVTNRAFDMGDSVDVPVGDQRRWDRTLADYNVQRLNKQVWEAYNTNPLFWAAVEMTVRMVVGNDVKLKANALESTDATQRAKGQLLQAHLDSFWLGSQNNWPTLITEVFRDLELFGEIFYAPIVDAYTGDVEAGFLVPEQVRKLIRSPLNYRRIMAIVVQDEKAQDVTLPLITIDRGGLARQQFEEYANVKDTTGRLVGRVMFWRINAALTAQRGHGDFVQILKPARDAMRIVSGITDRTDINNRLVLEYVFADNIEQAQINEMFDPNNKEKYINPPRLDVPGIKQFAHSKNVEFKIIGAQIAGAETQEVFKMIKAVFLAGVAGLPEHWIFGQGEDVNRASASDMGKQAYEFLSNRQTVVMAIIRDAVDHATDQRRIFSNALNTLTDEDVRDYTTILPEINQRSLIEAIDAGIKKIDAILAAVGDATLDQNQGAEMIRDVFTQTMNMKVPERTTPIIPVVPLKPAPNTQMNGA